MGTVLVAVFLLIPKILKCWLKVVIQNEPKKKTSSPFIVSHVQHPVHLKHSPLSREFNALKDSKVVSFSVEYGVDIVFVNEY